MITNNGTLFLDGIAMWVAIALICVVPSLAYFWFKWRQAEIDASLKEEMLARGMSADEIQKVLQASSTKESDEDE